MKVKIKGLDGLRAIAVLLVFIEHFVRGGHHLGTLGVRLFFVLSGFLIVGILHKQRELIESNASDVINEIKKFWSRRVRRIFPVYYLVLIILLIGFLIKSQSINSEGLMWYFLFSANLYIEYISLAWASFTHLWSISVEQHFYLLSSPLLLLFSKVHHKNILAGILVVAIFSLYMDLNNGVASIAIAVSSVINFSFMVMGGLIAINQPFVKLNKHIGLSALFLIALYIFLTDAKALESSYPLVVPLLAFGMSLLGCTALISYVTTNQSSLFVRLLEIKPLRKLGEISYGFYVYHYFTPRVPDWVHSYYLNRLWFVVQFAVTVLLAWISWNFMEKKLMNPSDKRSKSLD